jgi:hypothetical protein
MKVQVSVFHEGKSYLGEVQLVPVVTAGKRSKEPHPSTRARQAGVPRPAEAIAQLYHSGFFKSPRALGDAMDELAKVGYNFGKSSVATVLSRSDYLQARGRKGSYTYIQKYPPSA